MVRFIIFDVMGVIFTVGDDVEELLIPYIRSLKPGIPADSIKAVYLAASLGRLPSREFWSMMGFKRIDIPKIERTYLEQSFTLDAGFIPCVKALKERYGIVLLSNDVSEWSKYLRSFHNIEQFVDAAFISGDLGVRKPDPEIYRIALNDLKADPGECVFIDDSPERVDAARELGINSILFDREGKEESGFCVRSFEQLNETLPLLLSQDKHSRQIM